MTSKTYPSYKAQIHVPLGVHQFFVELSEYREASVASVYHQAVLELWREKGAAETAAFRNLDKIGKQR